MNFSHTRITRRLLFFLTGCLVYQLTLAQNYSNFGKDFWVGYGGHSSMFNPDGTINTTNGGDQNMVLYFTATSSTTITVEIPSTGWSRTYTIIGGGNLESDPIPKTGTDDARLDSEGVSNQGIHIFSDQPILAYCHIYDNGSAASSLLFPTNTLGQYYQSLNFTQQSDKPNSYSYCFAIATEDSTTIRVIPSTDTRTHKAWVPFTVTLQKGQVLNLFSADRGKAGNLYLAGDLTGTGFATITNGGPCKRIAVFSGSTGISINCKPNTVSTSDNLFQEVLPGSARGGAEYALVPTKNMPGNYYRILVFDTATVVTLNGTVLTGLINKKYYEIEISTPSILTLDKPAMVAQYMVSAKACGNTANGNLGDPEMTFLTPIYAGFNTVSFNTTNHANITAYYLNLVKRTDDPNSATLDGAPIGRFFKQFPFDTAFSYAAIKIDPGIHQVHADSGFSAMSYGYGNFESYAYNIGFGYNVSSQVNIQNPYASPAQLQTCNATPFKISVFLPFRPSCLHWDFSNNPALVPDSSIVQDSPVFDSTFLVRKTTYYRYSLPGYFHTDQLNNIPFKLTITKPTQDGCFDSAEYDDTIEIYQKPAAAWSLHDNSCINTGLHFQDSSTGINRQLVQWLWNFGNGDTSSLENPTETYVKAGNYTVYLRSINDIGCYADTSQPVFISSKPVADFSISGTDCIGNETFFMDRSRIGTGKIVKWNWDLGDGTLATTRNIVRKYLTPDTFTVKMQVSSEQHCASDTAVKKWIMYPYPKTPPPIDTFTLRNTPVVLIPRYAGTMLHYSWSPSLYLNSDTAAYPLSIPPASIYYKETITGNGGCSVSTGSYIDVIQYLEIPNAFSPNGDGINDSWVINNISTYPDVLVQVFNRYGQPVYTSTGYPKPWNGRYNGKPLPVGTYYYIINTKDKHLPISTGYVTILR